MTARQMWIVRTRWLLWNSAFVALVWFGVAGGIHWVANLLKFYLWLTLVGSALTAIAAGESLAVATEVRKRLAVPTELNFALDMAVGFFLAAHGWFGYATIAALAASMEAAARGSAKKSQPESYCPGRD